MPAARSARTSGAARAAMMANDARSILSVDMVVLPELKDRASRRLGVGGVLDQLDPSGLMPANLTTLRHFSVSAAMSLAKSAGDPGSIAPPVSTSRAFILGSANAALISWLSLAMITVGVLLGAATPYHWLAS